MTDSTHTNTASEPGNEPPRMRRFLVHDAPALVYVVIVFVLGSARQLPQPHVANWDKVEHLGGFGAMQWAIAWAFAGRPAMPLVRRLVLAAFASSALGALLEVYQLALPWRSADVRDWVADSIGAVLAAMAAWWFLRRRGSAGENPVSG